MGVFQPVQDDHRSLEGRIVSYIRDLVEQGVLTPGERLPPERELAAQLRVSRTALREALHTLAALGLVEARHGRGVFVVGGSLQATAQRLSLALEARETEEESVARIRQLFEIRRVLEGAAAEWAAQRAQPEQIAEMQAVLARDRALRTAAEVDRALISELDGQLHALIAASTANRLLVLLMASLLDELATARSRSLVLPERIRRSLEQHAAIVEAIAAHDPQAARASMIAHLDDVEQAIVRSLEVKSDVDKRPAAQSEGQSDLTEGEGDSN
ncbi:GntR family transcriptional regulator [Thermogemmatispora aurantia]|uniref:GntR family transcriptional regulator n=1 Tax=Thermogemmatispora aurantia TaxID=2045279 RepID=A0A5J4K570_9CHLR|nr:FCD domain-containing protein [Thermogemmatispora aurantia]GER83818.1 GntR family transcriptional regulator [Thermogemmatispora aurantia]